MTTHATSAPASTVSADTAPHQISERDRRSLQEAYRMIHAIAARSEEEERRQQETATRPQESVTVS